MRLNPYLNFRTDARAAMERYQEVLGGELTINTFGDFGMEDPDRKDLVMHAMLETDEGFTLMASDTTPEVEHQPGTNIAISLSGDDEESLRRYWDQLSEGGTVTMELEKQMWGDIFGMCVDRFGIQWMVDIYRATD